MSHVIHDHGSCNASASFGAALIKLVKLCQRDLWDAQHLRARINDRLREAAAVHGIDPAAVRRLLKVMMQSEVNAIDQARQEEVDAAYKAIVSGGVPVLASRVDTDIDKVMALVVNEKLPKIDDIMKAVSCSKGKASKLRGLAAARLAAKSSSSRKKRENELSEGTPLAATPTSPQEEMSQQHADGDQAIASTGSESMNSALDISNVVSLTRSD